MKRTLFILSILLFMFSSSNAFAKCKAGSVSASPNSKTILPANASVIITLFGTERAKFDAKKQKAFFFRSGKHKVKAKLIQTWESEFDLKAFQFKATKNLKVGRTYTLDMNGRKFSWKIAVADVAKPKWVSAPKQVAFKKVRYGCGPAVNFILTLDVTDASPVFYDVKMKTKGRKSQHFFVRSSNGKMKIGHGMCSGQFVPPRGSDVLVEMTPYDFAGNKGETKKLKLTTK